MPTSTQLPTSSFAQKITKKFGVDFNTTYVSSNKPVEIVHTCGNKTVFKSPTKALEAEYLCACLRPFPFKRVSKTNAEYFVLLDNQGKSTAQIVNETAVLPKLIAKVTAGKEEQGDYFKVANTLAAYVKKAFGVSGSFQFNASEAYTKGALPLSLKMLCHPANFGNKKFNVTALKKAIKKYPKQVVWPETYCYEFKRVAVKKSGLRVLGLDPGTANFGAFGGIIGAKAVEPILTEMISTALKAFTGADFNIRLDAFIKDIDRILAIVDPDVVLIERFQTRGLQGTTVELVGFMIGIVASRLKIYEIAKNKTVNLRPIIAGQWKNCLNKNSKIPLDDMYKMLGSTKLHHRLDAMMMASYAVGDSLYKNITVASAKKLAAYIIETKEMK
jgi:hypothetical protein